MINGHGDDLYKYAEIKYNFSSNVCNKFDHSKLFEYMRNQMDGLTSYPEPQPYTLEKVIAESNGNIYPCDFYCTDEYLLGNINTNDFETMANCETATKFLKESFFVPEKCRACKLYPMCRAGGCKRTRQSEDYCEAYQKFFAECLPLFQAFRQEKDGASQ